LVEVEEPAGNAAAARPFSSGAGRASLALNDTLFCKYFFIYLFQVNKIFDYVICST
jgi:hypothetical protein